MNASIKTAFNPGRIRQAVYSFFFQPALPYPLAGLRIFSSVVLLLQAFLVAPLFFELYGEKAILQGPISAYFAPPIPHITSVGPFLISLGLTETQALLSLGILYSLSLLGLLVGWKTRFMAVVAWFTHLVLAQGHSTSYGVDSFANVALFYLICIPSGKAWSLDARKGDGPVAEPLNRLALRTVQLHLTMTYVATGLAKTAGVQWWNGEAIWRSVMLPVYSQVSLEWLASFPWICMLAGWGTLIIEIGYPLLIFPRRTRKLWVALVLSLHVGIALFLGLQIFGLFMCALTASLFGVSPELRDEKAPAPSLGALPLALELASKGAP